MEQHTERTVALANVTVEQMTLHWQGVEDMPPYGDYRLSQRLSEDHPPLRIGNVNAPEVLPRVRSVGLLPPGHGIRMYPMDKPLRIMYCTFREAFFEDATGIPRDQWSRHVGSLVAMKNRRLEVLMQEIHAELEQPGFGHHLLIESVANLILVELARHGGQLIRRGVGRGDSLALAPWQLRRIEERIQASLAVGYPGLQELAELCGVSQGHLARSFKAATGWQIHKYIIEERLKAAKDLLAGEQWSCEEIASRLGFKSPSYFSTAFRRLTGKTPTEYRRQALATRLPELTRTPLPPPRR